jgi:hypothetical protein
MGVQLLLDAVMIDDAVLVSLRKPAIVDQKAGSQKYELKDQETQTTETTLHSQQQPRKAIPPGTHNAYGKIRCFLRCTFLNRKIL